LPHADGVRGFHTRVAVSVLGIVRRELALDDTQVAAELDRLEALLGPLAGADAALPARDRRRLVTERSEALCERIRRGNTDTGPFRDAVLAHIRATVRAKLEVSNPRWLASAGAPHPRGAARR